METSVNKCCANSINKLSLYHIVIVENVLCVKYNNCTIIVKIIIILSCLLKDRVSGYNVLTKHYNCTLIPKGSNQLPGARYIMKSILISILKLPDNLRCGPKPLLGLDASAGINISYPINPKLISLCFSVASTNDFIEDAEKTLRAQRIMRSYPEHSMLFQAHIPCHWGSDASVKRGEKKVSPEYLVTSLLVGKPPSRNSKTHDKVLMQRFLALSDCDALVYNGKKLTREQILPNRFPLLDLIAIRSKEIDSWAVTDDKIFDRFQSFRGLGTELLDEVTVREIAIGHTVDLEIVDILEWTLQQHRQDQLGCPVGVMSMDVEEVRIRTADYEKIVENSNSFNTRMIQITRWPTKGEPCTQLPVKIMLGNGLTWALMITVPVLPVSASYYEVGDMRFPEAVVQFLRDLPILVGVGIRSDVIELVELIRKTSDVSFSMRGWVDLSTLAVLAGWNFPRFNMQALSVQLLGGVMNKCVSRGDGEWGMKWEDLDAALQVYCLGDVKFGYMTAVTLAVMLLYDVFPDPEVVCSFTRSFPRAFAEQFFEWIFEALVGTEVSPNGLEHAQNRADLVNTIRTRNIEGAISPTPPSRVSVIGKILGSWPSIRFGGARFLHQVRSHFVTQCKVLDDSLCPQWQKIMPYDHTEREMWEAATYCQIPLSEEKWSDPDSTCKLTLVVHPEMMSQTLSCSGDQICNEIIAEVATKFCRNKRELVLEWVRTHLSDILSYFLRIEDDPLLARFTGSFYTEGRWIFRRCTGMTAPRVASIDDRRRNAAIKKAQIEREKMQKLRIAREEIDRAMQMRALRLQYYEELEADDDEVCSTLSWRGQLPASRVKSCSKSSRNDLMAALFNEACDREEILQSKDVDLVLPEERHERPHSEPVAKKRKRSNSTTPAAAAVRTLWEVESDEDYYEMQLQANRTDMDLY